MTRRRDARRRGAGPGAPQPVIAIATRRLAASGLALGALPALGHAVSGSDAAFVGAIDGVAVAPFIYLGAKHMVTGYDHLLFLAGVIFFLHRLRDVALYVTLFTAGHSLTLLAGVLGGWRANPWLVDAIIGFSIVYKAFENMDGFRRVFGVAPNAKAAVFAFGLCHGMGLATKLGELLVSPNGRLANLLSFNAGVEIGQFTALAALLALFALWRARRGFGRHAYAANVLLMAGGFALAGQQLAGMVLAPP